MLGAWAWHAKTFVLMGMRSAMEPAILERLELDPRGALLITEGCRSPGRVDRHPSSARYLLIDLWMESGGVSTDRGSLTSIELIS